MKYKTNQISKACISDFCLSVYLFKLQGYLYLFKNFSNKVLSSQHLKFVRTNFDILVKNYSYTVLWSQSRHVLSRSNETHNRGEQQLQSCTSSSSSSVWQRYIYCQLQSIPVRQRETLHCPQPPNIDFTAYILINILINSTISNYFIKECFRFKTVKVYRQHLWQCRLCWPQKIIFEQKSQIQ